MLRRIPALRRAGPAILLLAVLGVHADPLRRPMTYPNTGGFGVAFNSEEDWYRECMRVASLAPSRAYAARPGAEEQYSKTTRLYYMKRDQAATTAAEWRQVRQQALAGGDDGVLMMLYANGYGVPRDTDRAIYHACRLDTAKAEMEGRIAHLASGAAADGAPFDLCDDITSGRMGGVCAAIDTGRKDRVQQARLERFASGLPPTARAPFARLRQAATAFTRESTREVDMSGTGAAGLAFRHAGRRDEEFMQTLFKAADGKLPLASAAQLVLLDRELNAQYRALLAIPSRDENHPERIDYLTVTRDDIRATERAWLAYRDAWTTYLPAAGAANALKSVQAELTRQRITQLKRMQR